MSTDPTRLPNPRVRVPEMDQNSAVWEWGDLLDFTIYDEDPLTLPWDTSEDLLIPSPPPPLPPPPTTVVPEAVDEESPAPAISVAAGSSKVVRVRKRDPRLVCENFLAGRVPCACPELDAMMLEEEEAEVEAAAGAGRKRVRKGPAASATAAVLRCQVPGCEADIRELKGYHRRHRVCLRCATAASVAIDGEDKRYCQQCGK